MKVLKNHFEGKTTYIVGNYIRNGCQTFHVRESKEVFDNYKVPQEMIEEVLSYINNEDLNKYADSDDENVRYLVALQGYSLDKMMYDKAWMVRLAVAEQGFALDELINDEDGIIREEVARQGYGLDKLINDEDSDVRYEVAKQGYGLNILINDEDRHVRFEAEKAIKRQKRNDMRDITLLALFLAQVMSFALGFILLILLILINLQIPNKADLSLPCFALFLFGTASFLLTQILLYVWDKTKDEED